MAEQDAEPQGGIVTTLMYGQITVDFQGKRPVGVSDEVLLHTEERIHRKLRDEAVHPVEEIVEEEGVTIGDEHVHAKSDLPLTEGGDFVARVDCELAGDVSEAVQNEVSQILEDKLKPMKGLLSRMRRRSAARQHRSDEATEENFVRSVWILMGGGMRGRGG